MFPPTLRNVLLAAALLAAGLSALLAPAARAEASRERKLDFEDELVEGLNKKPYDSVSQISERDRNKHGSHLYWKRAHFQQETNTTLREMRFIQ